MNLSTYLKIPYVRNQRGITFLEMRKFLKIQQRPPVPAIWRFPDYARLAILKAQT